MITINWLLFDSMVFWSFCFYNVRVIFARIKVFLNIQFQAAAFHGKYSVRNVLNNRYLDQEYG